jgi:hypothetical protein
MIYRFEWIEKNGGNYHQPLFNSEQIIVKSLKNLATNKNHIYIILYKWLIFWLLCQGSPLHSHFIRVSGAGFSPFLRNKKATCVAFYVALSGLELFFQYAYNQLYTEMQFIQVSKRCLLCFHLLLQS